MQRHLASTAVAFLVFLPAACAQASTWTIDPHHSTAGFSVRHMMISNVKGEFGNLSGTVQYDGKNLGKAVVDATIDTNSINTREPNRDNHLKSPDFLDTQKYPFMAFKSRRIEAQPDGRFKMIGDLTLHGVTREVSFNVDGLSPEIKDPHGNIRIGTSASTQLNRKDFGLNFDKTLDNGGALVGDDVSVNLDVELVKKPTSTSALPATPGGSVK